MSGKRARTRSLTSRTHNVLMDWHVMGCSALDQMPLLSAKCLLPLLKWQEMAESDLHVLQQVCVQAQVQYILKSSHCFHMLQAQRTKLALTQTLRERPRSAATAPTANGVAPAAVPAVAVVEEVEEELLLVPAANRALRESLADFQV